MNSLKFSVCITVYNKENSVFFDRALESLKNQTVPADEWVIVKDGPLTKELDLVIDKYLEDKSLNIKVVSLEKNCGSGVASDVGIRLCSNNLVARMDSDDIAMPNRFELQIAEFKKDPFLDVCGGQITEFDEDENVPILKRIVPLSHEEIYRYHKSRSAINNVTVMLKKDKVLEIGGYKDFVLMEDYVLFAEMLNKGMKFKNIDVFLCNVRANRSMIGRRGGYNNYIKYKAAKKYVKKIGFINNFEYFKMNFINFAVCLMPISIRKFLYFNFIHKKVK